MIKNTAKFKYKGFFIFFFLKLNLFKLEIF
jgi:hypothetical protein